MSDTPDVQEEETIPVGTAVPMQSRKAGGGGSVNKVYRAQKQEQPQLFWCCITLIMIPAEEEIRHCRAPKASVVSVLWGLFTGGDSGHARRLWAQA